MPPLRLIGHYAQGTHVYQCVLCGCVYADSRPVEDLSCDGDIDDHDGDCLTRDDTVTLPVKEP